MDKKENQKKKKFKFKLRNRKIKFREADYVENHYIKDGKAVIPIFLKSIDDLYMKHDYIKLALSDDLCDYIEEIAYIIPLKYDIVLEIHCPEISEKEQIRIKKVIKNNYGMEIDDRDYDIRMANKKSITLFIIGCLILILSYALEVMLPEFLTEFFYIAGWVALWEMCESLMLNNATKRTERINKLQLYDSEVIFNFEHHRKPISEPLTEPLSEEDRNISSFSNVDLIINNSTVKKENEE